MRNSSGQGYQKNSNESSGAVIGDSLKSSNSWISQTGLKESGKYPFTGATKIVNLLKLTLALQDKGFRVF